jgi:hypothetical protein
MKLTSIGLLVGLACVLQTAGATIQGTNELGRPFVSGGASTEELDALNAERNQFSLSVLTAAKGTGAYLADVHVHITDAQSRPVLDTVMDGPLLLVDLPAGRYHVEADLNGTVKKDTVDFRPGARRDAIFYFDTHDQVETAAR